MVLVLLCISQILLSTLSTGQFYDPEYDYDRSASTEDEGFIFDDLGLSIQNEKERRFMEGLIVEAGRHVLFPKLYEVGIENQATIDSDPEAEIDLKEQGRMKFFEMKGQPEIEESYMNRISRSSKALCPEDCPVYRPVCGSDGKVYPSDCHLLRENCGNNVTAGDWDKCRGNHYLCPSRCLDLNEPVCGSDLKIYHNICIMRKQNCGKLLQRLPIATCYNKFSESASKDCPDQCPPIARPVCGSNGVIYFNDCFLKMRTCKQGIVQVSIDSCVYIPKCPQVCLPMYDPVCGSDGNLYTNHCRMMQANCGKEVKKMPSSFCSSGAQGS